MALCGVSRKLAENDAICGINITALQSQTVFNNCSKQPENRMEPKLAVTMLNPANKM